MVGGHWAILQTVAWVGMTVNYSRDFSLTSALVKTFDGKRPCKLCKFVSEGKKSEHKSENQLDGKKIDFFALAGSEFYFAPLKINSQSLIPLRFPRVETPPTPPPVLA